MTQTPSKSTYTREQVAGFLEYLNDWIERDPQRHKLTSEQRSEWAAFPSQARAHPFDRITLDPFHSLADHMRTGRIGPNYWPFTSAAKAVNQCK